MKVGGLIFGGVQGPGDLRGPFGGGAGPGGAGAAARLNSFSKPARELEVALVGGLFHFDYAQPVEKRALLALEGAAYSLLTAVSSPDLKAFLLATPFFGGLSDASLDVLLPMLVERRVQTGEIVIAEGDPGRSMFVVHSGKLEVRREGHSGGLIHTADLGPGDFFGEMTLIEMAAVLYELTAKNL